MYRRKRILLLSSSIILLCACLIAGATFALFTENAEIKTHLQAGKLEAELIREAGYYKVLDDKGLLKTKPIEGSSVDFTEATTENFFGDLSKELIVPQSEFAVVFTIKNTGTTAFTYDVEVASDDTILAGQLYVEIGYIDTENTTYDADGRVDEYAYLEPVAKGFLNETEGDFKLSNSDEGKARVLVGESSALMYARVTFVDNHNSGLVTDNKFADGKVNNDAMSGDADFDLFVTATQYTGE